MEHLIINGIFTLFMLALAFWDYRSFGEQKHRDFKSIIMSTGVLGTFVGIFVGLQDFDVNSIENSVPSLLAGLKVAFYTSILGMVLAILLSIVQKSKAVKSDFEQMLDYFSLQMGKLDNLESLHPLQKTLAEISTLHKTQLEAQSTYYVTQQKHFESLQDSFNRTNFALQEAMQHLAKGASKELIAALQEVIKDFNLRITEQFGDNFKELNNAVTQMISWQNQYRDSIAGLDSSLKHTLEAFEVTKDTLSLIAERNSEVLEVYQALASSIEASRVENEKLSVLLSGFQTMHEHAKAALESVDGLSKNLKEVHTQSLAHTRESLEGVKEFLTQSTQAQQEKTQTLLEQSLKTIEEDAKTQNIALKTLQNTFNTFNAEYITQNKEQLSALLEALKIELEQFMQSIIESDSKLKHTNLEMLGHLEASIKVHLDGVKDSFSESLEVLENAQKESLLLIENQAKKSDDVLIRHTQEMGSVVEKASHCLKELGEKTQQNLIKNSDTLEQHIVNAILNLDALLGKTTKSLEGNFEDSKNTLLALSKEIESSMAVTTKSLNAMLGDTTETLKEATQNISDSIITTNSTLKENFKDATTFIAEQLKTDTQAIVESFKLQSAEITQGLHQTTDSIAQQLDTSTTAIKESFDTQSQAIVTNFGNATESVGKSVAHLIDLNHNQSEHLKMLLEENLKSFTRSLQTLHTDSTQFSKDLQGQMRANFAESYKNALESLSAYLKNTTSAYQSKLQDFSKTSLDNHAQISISLKEILRTMLKDFESNYQKVSQSNAHLASTLLQASKEQLDMHTKQILTNYQGLNQSVQTTLQEMAKHYLGMIETLTKQSLEAPKSVSVELLQTFNVLQKNLGDAFAQTSHSLEKNRQEIEAILNITQTHIASSLKESTELNHTLCQSLGELDGALSNLTLGFRQDYEWFLRRIRELMGVRG